MKKLLIFSVLFTLSSTLFSQSIGYTDLGVLFSQENFQGTARYNAMSGAFGALGGDISSTYQNPAGGAVFSRSEVTSTYSYSRVNTNANYYDSNSFNTNDSSRFPQFGAVLVFDSPYASSKWKKFSLGFNYSLLNDFRGNYNIYGNNKNYARYDTHPLDSDSILYDKPIEQYFENVTDGRSEVYTFSLSSAYEDYFYIGSSLNFHNIEFTQDTFLNETNINTNNEALTAKYTQYLSEISTGISLGIGMIIKPFRNLRLGLAYQSPVWYFQIQEDSNALGYDNDPTYSGFKKQGYLDIHTQTNDWYQNTTSDYPDVLVYDYSLNTPEKWTASAAITLGQHGLISADIYQKNYKLIRLNNNNDFESENQEIINYLDKARGIRAGAELRFNQISLRGGAFIDESPYKVDEEDIYRKGASIGLGLKFKHSKLDFAYQYSELNDEYSIYHSSEPVENISLLQNNKRITATLTITF